MITHSNHACFAKMAICGFQEGVLRNNLFEMSPEQMPHLSAVASIELMHL
jgi:hypothetical protein